jgi:GNAT superfamily N-acetyltransferase
MRLETDGYYEVPAGKIASIVTFLEMSSPPPERGGPARPDLSLRRVTYVDPAWYRELFTRIGREWLWASRLLLSDRELGGILNHPATELYVPMSEDREIGFLEFDFRVEHEAELVFFGLVPEAVGGGAGRWLMNKALRLAWRPEIRRVWLHTCTLDHPAAAEFYRRSGFVPYRAAVEIGPDPRALGLLPRASAPRVPLLPAT